jgi:hypothetical protein
VAVFDVEKPKKPVKEFNTESFSMKSGAVSGDGKFLAVASVQSLKVYDLVKGTAAATMSTPAFGNPIVFNSCSGLAFSPNNEELAAALGSSVVVWSNRGKIIDSFPEVAPANPFSKFNNMSYLPDGSGWFVNGQALLDRARKIVVWQLQTPFANQHPAMVLDAEHLLVSGGSINSGKIAVVKIPAEEIAKATKAMESDADAVLAPGKQISITYEISEPRFSSRVQVVNELNDVLAKRLEQFGITVADNQPVTLKVVYTEMPGNTVEYSEGRGFGPPIPRPFGGRSPNQTPGKQVVETKHQFTATLFRKDDERSWWSANLVQTGPQSLKGDITEQNIRNGSFEMMKHSVGNLVLPRFLPVDPEIPALPIKSDLGKL